jgi:hypothetical protein
MKRFAIGLSLALLSILTLDAAPPAPPKPRSAQTAGAIPTPTPPPYTPVSVTLAWDASPSTGVTGYRLHYGVASGLYTQALDVGVPANLQATVSGLTPDTYYFAVTAYNAEGGESWPSDEVSTAVPVPTPTPAPTATPSATPTPTASPTPTPVPTPNPPKGLHIVKPSLANISTRAEIGAGNKVVIGGFIVRAADGQKMPLVIRGLGSSLQPYVPNEYLKVGTRLDLYDSTGERIDSNEGWETGPYSDWLRSMEMNPPNPDESALYVVLGDGHYTAIVRAINPNVTGVGLVEVYALN